MNAIEHLKYLVNHPANELSEEAAEVLITLFYTLVQQDNRQPNTDSLEAIQQIQQSETRQFSNIQEMHEVLMNEIND